MRAGAGRLAVAPVTRAPETLRELLSATAQASDSQLMKLVRTLDAMPRRGSADDLLRPVRPRLRTLQPPRPLTLSRLLFLPLDPLLVSPCDWRPRRGQVPRSAIAPIAAAVAAAAPVLAAGLQAELAGLSLDALHLVAGLGRRLWPAAAALDLPVPVPGWKDTGLPAAACAEVLSTSRAIWRHGAGLWRLRMEGPQGPPEASARPVLQGVLADGGEALGLALATVLPFAAQPSRLAGAAAALGGGAAPAADRALESFIAALDPGLEASGLAAGARSAERLTALIEDLAVTVSPAHAARAQRLHGLRQAVGQSCLRRLEAEAGPTLAAALDGLAAAPEITDAAMETLEASMVGLRALADAARRLDRAVVAEAALRPAIAALGTMLPRLPDSGTGLRRADALRLLELLDGPDRAAECQRAPG
jgi:hypothetical protein